MKSKREEVAEITFINVLKYIECGEMANITINGQNYNISVNNNDEKYYIGEESFKDREEFIKGLSTKTQIQLSENSIIILNSIVDGSVKVDSTWKFKDRNEDQVNADVNIKYNLYKNILKKIIILYAFIIAMICIFFIEINSIDESYHSVGEVGYSTPGRYISITVYMSKEDKQVIAALLIINNISIAFFKENRMRLKALSKYSKKEINKIEEKIITYKKENVSFSTEFDICFSEESLILVRKANLQIIDYEDIVYILNIEDYFLDSEREICIITKNKKIIRMKIKVARREEFKNKLLEKNPKIIFKKSRKNKKNEILDIDGLNIRNIVSKDIIITCYKIWSKTIAIFSIIFYLINDNLLLYTHSTYTFMRIVLISFSVLLIFCCIFWGNNKIKNISENRNIN